MITKEKIQMIKNSEKFLNDLGFRQARVRMHNNVARIEVMPDNFEKVLYHSKEITSKLKANGCKFVALDIEGYRPLSMNEAL